ncbi:MAG: 30S ribosomal protein S21 [Bacteriovoracaceae bacterium]|jgi:small subunit ribosomal protein S21|nr:30S ribosomal protein S21 [Halobacteriovoraceae bacterium]MDP7321140.1 30S ribosomal protein S21 [Bacteriovoracaceae bacterium]
MSTENIRIETSQSFSAEKAIRKFKRLCDMYGVTKEYRKRKEHKKPSMRLREKKEAAQKRRLKQMRKDYKRFKAKI